MLSQGKAALTDSLAHLKNVIHPGIQFTMDKGRRYIGPFLYTGPVASANLKCYVKNWALQMATSSKKLGEQRAPIQPPLQYYNSPLMLVLPFYHAWKKSPIELREFWGRTTSKLYTSPLIKYICQLLRSIKNPREPLSTSGVYRIPCSCGSVYAGIIQRSISTCLT